MKSTLNWYTLYTRPRCEKRVMALLASNGIESYCPFRKSEKTWNKKIKTVEEPLFRSYVFVKIPAQQVEEMRSVEGIINVLYWQEQAAVIPDQEIEMLRKFLFDFPDVKLEKTVVNPAEAIEILSVPVTSMGEHSIAITYPDIRINLPTLGYSIIANREKSDTETIDVISNKSAAKPVSGKDQVEL